MCNELMYLMADAMKRRDEEVYNSDVGYDFYLEMADAAVEAYEIYRAHQDLRALRTTHS